MPTIIMTIKPRHLRNMALGIKRYELRKTVPRLGDGGAATFSTRGRLLENERRGN